MVPCTSGSRRRRYNHPRLGDAFLPAPPVVSDLQAVAAPIGRHHQALPSAEHDLDGAVAIALSRDDLNGRSSTPPGFSLPEVTPPLKTVLAERLRSDWQGHVTVPKGGRSRQLPMTQRLTAAVKGARHLRGERILCLADGSPITRDE